MCSPMPDINLEDMDAPGPCDEYPECDTCNCDPMCHEQMPVKIGEVYRGCPTKTCKWPFCDNYGKEVIE